LLLLFPSFPSLFIFYHGLLYFPSLLSSLPPSVFPPLSIFIIYPGLFHFSTPHHSLLACLLISLSFILGFHLFLLSPLFFFFPPCLYFYLLSGVLYSLFSFISLCLLPHLSFLSIYILPWAPFPLLLSFLRPSSLSSPFTLFI